MSASEVMRRDRGRECFYERRYFRNGVNGVNGVQFRDGRDRGSRARAAGAVHLAVP